MARIYHARIHRAMSAYFHYRSLEELRDDAQKRSLAIPLEADRGRVQATLGWRVQVGRFNVRNALAIHPMESFDREANGAPDDLTERPYDRLSARRLKH